MRNRHDRWIMSASSRQWSIELFDVEFVDFALDYAPVAQIDASLGESAAVLLQGDRRHDGHPARNRKFEAQPRTKTIARFTIRTSGILRRRRRDGRIGDHGIAR